MQPILCGKNTGKRRDCPGVEPGTSCILSAHHATRPTNHKYEFKAFSAVIFPIQLIQQCTCVCSVFKSDLTDKIIRIEVPTQILAVVMIWV